MDFKTIRRSFEVEMNKLNHTHHDLSIKQYENSGGGRFIKSWRTIGCYVHLSDDRRLVFESLLSKHDRSCITRIYDEAIAEVHFAQKTSRKNLMPNILDSASDVFVALVSDRSESCSDDEVEQLPWFLRAVFRKSLLPVPPPFKLQEIVSVEQDAAPNH